MNVREGMLLPFLTPTVAFNFTKNFGYNYVVKQKFYLHLKYPCYQIWSVGIRLAVEVILNFWPVWICGESYE